MNIATFVRSTTRVLSLLPTSIYELGRSNIIDKCGRMNFSSLNTSISFKQILQPLQVSLIPSCGMKVKGRMKRRCKDCYFVRREGRLYIMCTSFPRHKQTHIVPKERHTWILSHACQSKLRPY